MIISGVTGQQGHKYLLFGHCVRGSLVNQVSLLCDRDL